LGVIAELWRLNRNEVSRKVGNTLKGGQDGAMGFRRLPRVETFLDCHAALRLAMTGGGDCGGEREKMD
jgi:hypothetical protein